MKKGSIFLLVVMLIALSPCLSIAKSTLSGTMPVLYSATEQEVKNAAAIYSQQLQNKQYKQAIITAKQIIQMLPSDSESYNLLGIAYFLDEQYQESLPYLQKAASMNPAKFDYHFTLAAAYEKTNDIQSAINSYNKAMALKPSNVKNLQLLGNAYYESKDYTSAIKIYKKVLKYSPQDVVYCTLLGLSHINSGDNIEGLKTLESCLIIDPKNEDALKMASQLALNEKQWEKSKKLYTQFKMYYPKYSDQIDEKLQIIAQNQLNAPKDTKPAQKKSKDNKSNEEYVFYVSKTVSESPSNEEIALSTPLYTGAINPISESGKAFIEKQKVLTSEMTEQIDILTNKFTEARKLNKDFHRAITNRLILWKKYYDKDKTKEPVYNTEKELFNFALMLQLKEDNKWAIIDAVLEEIALLKQTDTNDVSNSIRKSYLYSNLLVLYVDLTGFYKEKYKDLLYTVNINNAMEVHPALPVKPDAEAINKLKNLNEDQLSRSKLLIESLAGQAELINTLGDKSKEVREIYHEMDKYSLTELEILISGLENNISKLKASTNNPDLELAVDMLPAMEAYLLTYKDIKNKLSSKILSYEMTEAIIASQDKNKTITLASIDTSIPSLVYSLSLTENIGVAWDTLKGTVKTVVTSASAGKDYLTAKGKEYIIDKPKAIRQYGLFTSEYNSWSQKYDKEMDVEGGPSIMKTFWEPVVKTAQTGESQKTYNESMQFVGDGVNLAYSTAKSGVTLVTSTIDKGMAKTADTIYGTDTAKDINITKDVKDTFLLDETAKSLDKSRVPFGLSYAVANTGSKMAADVIYGSDKKETETYIKKDIVDPLSKWYSGDKSTVGQQAIHQAGTSLDDFEKGVASYMGDDTQVSNALLNLVTIGTWDVMKGSNKLMDKSASTNEQAFALLDFVGGVNSMRNIPKVADKLTQMKNTVKESFDNFVEKQSLKYEKNIALKDLIRSKNDLQKALKEGNGWKIDTYNQRMYEIQAKMDGLSRQLDSKSLKNIADVPREVLGSKEMKDLAVQAYEDLPEKSVIRSVFEEGANGTATNYIKFEAQTASNNPLTVLFENSIETSLKDTSETVRSQLADSFKKPANYENLPDLTTKYTSSKQDTKPADDKKNKVSGLNTPYSNNNDQTKTNNVTGLNTPYDSDQTKNNNNQVSEMTKNYLRQQATKKLEENQRKQTFINNTQTKTSGNTLNTPYSSQQNTGKSSSANTLNTPYSSQQNNSNKQTTASKKTPIIVPQICYQSTYNWIPKSLCGKAWQDVNGNVALFHRRVGEYVRQYNIKRP